MLNKRENTMKVGDVVRSLDFVNLDDCYYIGKVSSINTDGTFSARTIYRIWQGDVKEQSDETFTAPLPGNHFADHLPLPRKFERVKVIMTGLP